MSIAMQIPEQFLQGVNNGTLIRRGCLILGEQGRILGHLKEAGDLSRQLSSLPFPSLPGLAGVAQVGQWIDTHAQLRHVQTLLNQLKLVTSIGAVASVAGLGVSIAGFAIVMTRLNRLESRLNQGMAKILAEIDRLHLKMDMLQMAELKAAWQRLDGAVHTDRPERQAELLKDADACFQKYRNYYFAMIMEVQPLSRPELSFAQVRELFARFFACAAAELESNFLLDDFAQYHRRHESIVQQMREVCGSDPRQMLRSRVDALGLLSASEHEYLRDQVKMTHEVNQENCERIDTAREEALWVGKQGLTSANYLDAVRRAPDQGIVWLAHQQ